LAVLAAALAMAGCASAQRTALKRASAASAGALAAGDYGKALDLYQKLYEKDRANGKVVSRYAALIAEVKAAGDKAANTGSYATAQTAYRLLADRWDGFSALARRLSFKKPDLEEEWKDCRLALCERQFRQEASAGNYPKALAAYRSPLEDYPLDAAVRSRYLKGVAEIAAAAERAFQAGDFAVAGRVTGLLLKNIESFETGAQAAGTKGIPSREALTRTVRTCVLELTNSGLVEYRRGNLGSAIAYWDGLLAFDPANAEIKKAVETARAQLGKLRSSGKGSPRKGGHGPGAAR
jgi:tetratricopeptide (TPR) repeat protein